MGLKMNMKISRKSSYLYDQQCNIKDITHIISKLLPTMESELKLNALTTNAKQRQLQLDLVKHQMLKFQKLFVQHQFKNHSKDLAQALISTSQVVLGVATVEKRRVVKLKDLAYKERLVVVVDNHHAM